MKFWKMHGLGNDYVVINNRDEKIGDKAGELARKLCERRFSIGADGLLLLCNSDVADVKMRIFNADGSEAEMCGNGIRCLVKYCYENKIVQREYLMVETLAGIMRTWLTVKAGIVQEVRVDMGKPVLERSRIPMFGHDTCINEALDVDGEKFRVTCLSMGNPHCVLFVNDLKGFPVERIGPKIENHRLFPKRTNVEFVHVLNEAELTVRVWERGVGETLACGTGACASVVAGNLLKKIGDKSAVHLLGGDLKIEYTGTSVFMMGPAEKAFKGEISWQG